jgi:alpha-D-ribose 1-methylphosphonate 5-triphosphate synthase subunit PhnH
LKPAWTEGQLERSLYNAATFRALLDAMARPGKIIDISLPAFLDTAPTLPGSAQPANLFCLSALLSLLDGEVSFVVNCREEWLPVEAEVARWLAFRSGSRYAPPAAADFALFCDGSSSNALLELSQGTLLEPESGATAFFAIEKIAASPDNTGGWLALTLSGPGIAGTGTLYLKGLEPGAVKPITATRTGYPQGLDLYLVDEQGGCVGLPRTTCISIANGEQ